MIQLINGGFLFITERPGKSFMETDAPIRAVYMNMPLAARLPRAAIAGRVSGITPRLDLERPPVQVCSVQLLLGHVGPFFRTHLNEAEPFRTARLSVS
jgi:hypothetical protein